MKNKITLALYFANRGFMPAELIESARQDMMKAVKDAGFDYIIMDKEATRYGAVETRDEGLIYAKWLKENEGKFQGVICCMPIFADENGAITALRDANVPILMQAYPDEIGKMDFAHRRDAFCGKFSVTDVFSQYKVPFTVLKNKRCHNAVKHHRCSVAVNRHILLVFQIDCAKAFAVWVFFLFGGVAEKQARHMKAVLGRNRINSIFFKNDAFTVLNRLYAFA